MKLSSAVGILVFVASMACGAESAPRGIEVNDLDLFRSAAR